MAKSWVDSSHYRVTSENGEKSALYHYDNTRFGSDECVELATHHSDGCTTAYERDNSVHGLFNGGWKEK